MLVKVCPRKKLCKGCHSKNVTWREDGYRHSVWLLGGHSGTAGTRRDRRNICFCSVFRTDSRRLARPSDGRDTRAHADALRRCLVRFGLALMHFRIKTWLMVGSGHNFTDSIRCQTSTTPTAVITSRRCHSRFRTGRNMKPDCGGAAV